MSALHAYAIEQGCLALICEEQGVRYQVDVAFKLIEMATRRITSSLEQRSETEYSLLLPDGQPNARRVASVKRYFVKATCRRE
jgi:hypothetical protein